MLYNNLIIFYAGVIGAWLAFRLYKKQINKKIDKYNHIKKWISSECNKEQDTIRLELLQFLNNKFNEGNKNIG